MFYRFNAHRHAATNQKKTAGKAGQRAASKVCPGLINIQRRWEKFTDIHTGGFPGILLALVLGNLACAAVLVLLCILLVTADGPTNILPPPDRTSMPTMPDQFPLKEGPEHLSEFGLYLDSLERAFLTDSINEIQTLNK